MQQVYPNEALTMWFAAAMTVDIDFHLYVNDVTIDRDTVLADLDEMAGDGYAAQTVVPSDWIASGVVADVGFSYAAPVVFTADGADWTIYGFYVTLAGAGAHVLWGGRFDGAPIIVPDGESVIVIPTLGDRSTNPT